MANNDNPDVDSAQADAARGLPTTNNTTANTSAARRSPPTESRKPDTSPPRTTGAPPPPPFQKANSTSLVPVAVPATTSSAGASPRTSRNTSPARKDSRQQPLANPPATQPSAAAIQRALSAASVPQLPAAGVAEAVSKLPKTSKSAAASGESTPRWPTSPRLKSPPPSATNSRRGSAAATQAQQQVQQKKVDGAATAPGISVQGAASQTATPPPAKQGGDETAKVQQQQLQTPVKGSSRGASGKSTLETVQENSADDIREPSPAAVKAAADLKPLTKLSDEDGKTANGVGVNGEGETTSLHAESGSESAGAKNDRKKDPGSIASRPKNGTAKSYASLASTKSRQPEGKQNMTVETETVQSIPQSAINAGDRSGSTRNENSGSVKLKPSNETIRPKKERKKTAQKARSVNQGTASSKADIFEARVANAVDEANSSDSEETFVYESNPPEPPQRRARHHSRTPSVTSSHSVADAQQRGGGGVGGVRAFGDALLDERRVAGKRSMKFSNNAYMNSTDADTPDGGSKDGSVRSHTPRHFGRFGRGGSHASMFDPDSPFTQASKLRSQQLGVRHSRPGSPRSPQSAAQQQQQRASGLFGKKTEPSYDFDAEGGDDERTPLVGTVRTSRRLPRRISSRAGPDIDEYYGVRRHPRCGRFGGCMLGFIVFAAAILAAVAFLVMSNRPMYEVKIRKIQNVLASEQELILDLLVGAVNPNALGISVEEMNVDIFAKSKHIGDAEMWAKGVEARDAVVRQRRRRQALPELPSQADGDGWQDLSSHWHAPAPARGGVDEGTDPPDFPDDDLDHDSQTMLLGRIYHFDQGLEFEGSPLKRHVHYSVGELRLSKPGNHTEAGGSAKWEEVLQYPFELIIRGVLKYQLPISSRVESAAVGASIMVHPETGVDEFGRMRVHEVDRSEEWQWIEWEDFKDDVPDEEVEMAVE